MKVTISGKQINIGQALQVYVEDGLQAGVSKYFDRATSATVQFSKEKHLFCAHIFVNEGTGTGIAINGEGKEDEIHAAFDKALARIEKQLRRYKRKLKNHHVDKEAIAGFATKYVLSEDGQEVQEDAQEDELIIAEKQSEIEHLTVSDAVMRMNLANLPALMFINKKNGAVNVVYRRDDGNVSWVDYNHENAA